MNLRWLRGQTRGATATRRAGSDTRTVGPYPPLGVRLEYPDGTQSRGLPVIFKGYERREGVRVAVWEAMAPDSRPCIGVTVDHMPAYTSLQIAAPVPPAGWHGPTERTYRDEAK